MENANSYEIDVMFHILKAEHFELENPDYRSIVNTLPRAKNIHPIGPSFYILIDYKTMEMLDISEDCLQVLGYTRQELIDIGRDFNISFVHPNDTQAYLEMFQLASEHYYYQCPIAQRLDQVFNFYMRMQRKDGTYVKLLNQSLFLSQDKLGNLLLGISIYTDVSSLGLSDEVQLNIFNKATNQNFQFKAGDLTLDTTEMNLSKREKEIIQLLCEGKSSREVAVSLFLSYHTVRTHRKNILKKTGQKNTAALVQYALNKGWV